MTQHSLTTRLEQYINTMLPETHGHQRKAFRDFVAALLVVRTCGQATLARCFDNFEAASRRLTRTRAGSVTATPWNVGNQSWPWGAIRPPGWLPPLHVSPGSHALGLIPSTDAAQRATAHGEVPCLALTGDVLWTERLKGNYAASPLLADGKIFYCNRDGETTVIEPGPTFQGYTSHDAVGARRKG